MRLNQGRQRRVKVLLTAWILALAVQCHAPVLFAGSFITSEPGFEDDITHPIGYDGTGGTIEITVCIDPASDNASDMVIPVRNAIARFNELSVTTENLSLGSDNDLSSFEVDFESVAVHEIGHCMGLGHPNQGAEAGVNSNFTMSTPGPDGSSDYNDGADSLDGSADDLRDDDANLHWFRMSTNNPLELDAATIDTSTYSIDLGDLPSGDLYAANADRDVAADLGFVNTEAVMQQGQFTDEAQRTLTADDVATLRLAMAGIDETQGTSDDYDFELSYAGLTPSCDIVFQSNTSGFASCSVGFTTLSGNHTVLTSGTIRYNSVGSSWFFNDVLTETGTLIVQKATSPADDSVTFSFSGDVEGDISNSESLMVADLLPGTYTTTEAESLFYDLSTITCDDSDSSGNTGTRTATYNLQAGETVTCTFNSTSVPCKAADNNLVVSGLTISGDASYEACETLTLSAVTVENGASVSLLAGESIILDDGFLVEPGGSLSSRVEQP